MAAFLTFLAGIPRLLSKQGWLFVIILTLGLALFATCSVNSWQERKAKEQAAAAASDFAAKERAASEASGDARLQDYKDTQQNKDKLNAAVASLPDDVPSPRRIALACQRLRNAGTPDSGLPSACRPPAPAQAPSGA